MKLFDKKRNHDMRGIKETQKLKLGDAQQGQPWGMGRGATAHGPAQGGAHDVVHIYNIAEQK